MKGRDKLGRFTKTTGSRRYKSKSFKGRDIQRSRLVWMEHNGPIPKGYHIHHKNGNKLDDCIDNLVCLSAAEHNRLHAKDRPIWNKGLIVKNSPKLKGVIQRALKVRKENYLQKCEYTHRLYTKYSLTQRQVAVFSGLSSRQIFDRIHYWRTNGRKEK